MKIITFKTAKLAKEKGYNKVVSSHYEIFEGNTLTNFHMMDNWNDYPTAFSAPYQEEMAEWLREKGFHISIGWFYNEKKEKGYFNFQIPYRENDKCWLYLDGHSFHTYEEAMEKAIKVGLSKVS